MTDTPTQLLYTAHEPIDRWTWEYTVPETNKKTEFIYLIAGK